MAAPTEAEALRPVAGGEASRGALERARRRIAYSGRNRLGSHRPLYPLLRLARPRNAVTRSTQACIEGFPRSANTWAVFPFRVWNPGVKVAHHLHVPMQVRRSVALGVPCAVLLRRPLDALTSLLVMDRGRLSQEVACRSYVNFYAQTLHLRDSVVVCGFEEVTADPALVVERLNERYGTAFHRERLDAAERAALERRIERYQRREGFREVAFTVPSQSRRQLGDDLRRRLAESSLMERADEVYRAWMQPKPQP